MLSQVSKKTCQDNNIVLQAVDQIFEVYDKDYSGQLSKVEFPYALNGILQKLGSSSICNEDCLQVFEILDVSGDQKISKTQFCALIITINEILKMNKKKGLQSSIVNLPLLKQSFKL